MKILFDQNVPKNLRRYLHAHAVSTAYEMGWARAVNGQLLAMAEAAGFAVFLTGDRNLAYQQNLVGREIAIVELTKNNWPAVRPHVPEIVRAIDSCGQGSYVRVVCGR